MMLKLTLHEKWLYRRKKYDALSKLMRSTKDGVARFDELCSQDASLQTWLGQASLMMAAMIGPDSQRSARMREVFKREGQGKLFDLHKTLAKKGFVTVEEAAAVFGITTEEMKATIAAYPALFKAWHISGC